MLFRSGRRDLRLNQAKIVLVGEHSGRSDRNRFFRAGTALRPLRDGCGKLTLEPLTDPQLPVQPPKYQYQEQTGEPVDNDRVKKEDTDGLTEN